MNKKHTLSVILGASFCAMSVTAAGPIPAVSSPTLTIPQAIRIAEHFNPDLQVARDREKEAEEGVKFYKSLYAPTVDAQAVDSWGFPASNGGLGTGGLIGSPYRSGPAVGLVSKLALFDLGRAYGVQTAQAQLQVARAQTLIVRYQVDQEALQIYLEAAQFRAQQAAAHAVGLEMADVAREVERFVRTGQRSVVERLLVQDQIADAAMTEEGFEQRALVGVHRLELFIGQAVAGQTYPEMDALSEGDLGLVFSNAAQSPLLGQAAAQAQVAHSAVHVAQALNYPKVSAMASVGEMSKTRVVNKQDYSGGVGIDLPLFTGGGITDQVHRAQALASEQDHHLMAIRWTIDDMNAHYDETINASRVQLADLQRELELAQRAFRMAKNRYNSFQGTLVDVREALRNLARVRAEIIDMKTSLLTAVGSKALLNGAVATGS